MMGMLVGDAIGAPLEFSAVRYDGIDFDESSTKEIPVKLWTQSGYNTFSLKPGQWTDDASMGICIADCLLTNKGFDPLDLRLRFVNWWSMGYNNAFGFDEERGSKGSVGLGGNISQSMSEFMRDETPYTLAGDRFTCGNGSVMRNAAVPLAYHKDMAAGMDVARKQSKTTHQGDEAAECCAIMTWLAIQAINEPNLGKKELLERLPQFQSEYYSIQCLCNSVKEERNEGNKNLELKDRNWNWKNPNFRFSPTRAANQPGYVGSYCMDAMSMALHCVWTTESFSAAMLKIINLRGDSDSTGSVCAQIAGSIYGIDAIPQCWRDAVQRWDKNMNMLKAFRLMKLL
jgi:ADP-ribosylglycohydrolase